VVKKSSHSRKLSVYSNLSHAHKTKKDAAARKRAQYLATLPKHPVKRLLYRLHPKRFWGYWFSKRGGLMALKITGIGILLLLLLVGGLFAYFRKDLDAIRPEELAKRVQTTVTKYYDRNDELLWEDKGDGNYKLVVESDELSNYLKDATIAIEDQDFYSHSGVSISGLTRAFFNNLTGDSTQGGSTLTQQLVKQVFFADEASDRGLTGIPRKIKELILSVEVERMYDKDQILTLYLNESPYGGRRNGAESGAQTYFGKTAKDLTLAEAALLAAIPQNPSVYDPYNTLGHKGLIARQHVVLDNMANQGMVTRAEADEAKKFPIIDSLQPESTQYAGIKAPHFVQMVRSQLEQELGKATVGRGGLTVKTTLDYRIQQKLEEAMTTMFNSSTPNSAGFSNAAATVADSQTGQIIALMGSRDFTYEGYGQDNAATAYIQPGSTVKPFVYGQLFQQKPAGQANYGSGTVLKDENIDAIYGGKLQNADRSFKGDLPIRISLATSRNIPAVKAMVINETAEKGSTLETIHALGADSYCTQGTETQVGYAAAIGGCGIRQVDLVNAYTALARGGVYKKQASVLEVKNNSGEVLKSWTDEVGEKILDPQSAYIISDILTDRNARASFANTTAMNIPGVKTATKTGTSDKDGKAKDLWMMSYSPALTMGVWLGNSDTTILRQGNSTLPGPIIQTVMEYAHKTVYAGDGRWKSGDWFTQPAGIQRVGNELYPSWWNKNQGQTNAKLVFDKLSKYKATACTPEGAKIELDVVKSIDPVTKKDIYSSVPDGYDASKDDDKHSCTDVVPSITTSNITSSGGPGTYTISVTVTPGTFSVTGVTITVGSTQLTATGSGTTYTASYTATSTGPQDVTATATDAGFYTGTSPVKSMLFIED
jgi:membrane peptidoglycan carboxypeptidase